MNSMFLGFTNENAAVANGLRTALTYLDVPELAYGNSRTLFSEKNPGSVNTTTGNYEIDCSSFVSAVLSGITYKNSAYKNAGINYPRVNHFVPDYSENWTTHSTRMLANDLAYFASKRRWLYEVSDSDFSNVLPGDMLFTCRSTNAAYWNNVDHVMLVVDKEPRRVAGGCYIRVLEALNVTDGSSIVDRRYTKAALKDMKCTYGARFPLVDSTPVKQIGEVKESDVSNWGIISIPITEGVMEEEQIYSIQFHYDTDDKLRCPVIKTDVNTTLFSFYNYEANPDGLYKGIFYIPRGTLTDAFKKKLVFYHTPQGNGKVKDLKVFEGVLQA